SCSGVKCGEGGRCAVRHGRVRCVCAPPCTRRERKHGPVCGSDSRTYKHVCRLRKRQCRGKDPTLQLEYQGPCQQSCQSVRCTGDLRCVLDQNGDPHCVACRAASTCDEGGSDLCGSDGRTYPSACELESAACELGRAIPVAHEGPCLPNATCSTVRCRPGQSCLVEATTGRPRCVTCPPQCDSLKPVAVCASNNATYTSWCEMMKQACRSGLALDVLGRGTCPALVAAGRFPVRGGGGRSRRVQVAPRLSDAKAAPRGSPPLQQYCDFQQRDAS
ncbi:unnamed protein product, partial [Darwinula stevensoni]